MKTAVKLVLCAVALLSLNGPSVTEATFRGLQAGKHKDCDSGLEPVPTPAPTFDKPTPAPSGPSTKNPTPAPSASTTPAPMGGKPTPAPSGSNSSPVQTSAPAPTSGKPVPSPTGNSPVPTPISNAPAPTSNPAPSSSSGAPAPTSSGPTPAPSSAPPSTPTPVPSSVTPTTWKLDEIHDHTGKDCNGNIVSNMKQNVTDPAVLSSSASVPTKRWRRRRKTTTMPASNALENWRSWWWPMALRSRRFISVTASQFARDSTISAKSRVAISSAPSETTPRTTRRRYASSPTTKSWFQLTILQENQGFQ